MKKATYTIMVIACTLTISGILTGAGYYLGISQDFMIDMNSVNNMEKEAIKAAIMLNQIEYLDKGEIDKAKQQINMHLDSSIVTLDALLDCYPVNQKEDKQSALIILQKIADHRKQYSKTTSLLVPTQGDIEIKDFVDETLRKYDKN